MEHAVWKDAMHRPDAEWALGDAAETPDAVFLPSAPPPPDANITVSPSMPPSEWLMCPARNFPMYMTGKPAFPGERFSLPWINHFYLTLVRGGAEDE